MARRVTPGGDDDGPRRAVPKQPGICLVFLPPNVRPSVLPRLTVLAQEWPGDHPVVLLVATGSGVRKVRLGVRVQPTGEFQVAMANLLAKETR